LDAYFDGTEIEAANLIVINGDYASKVRKLIFLITRALLTVSSQRLTVKEIRSKLFGYAVKSTAHAQVVATVKPHEISDL
jgi:hypothetical protein